MVANNGRVAVGSTSPYARLSIHANNGDTHKMLFAVGSSTAAESIPFFSISNTGNVGIGGTNSTNSGFTQLTVTAGTSTITRIGQANLSGARNPGIWVQGRYAYIVQGGNTTNGLEIFDVSTSTPSFVSRIDLATGNNAAYQGNDIIVQGRYAYVVEGYGSTNAFEIFDVSNPNRPTRISQSDLAYGQFWTNKTIEIQGRYAYILGGGQTTSALEIFDISNPAAPVRISQTNITNGGQTYSDMHVQGRYAYIVEGSGTTNAFEIFDVSNPAVPVRVGQANLANTTNLAGTSIFVQGSYAYIVEAAAANGFEIFDISDPTAPIRLSQTTTLNSGAGGTNPDIWVQGRYAYIAGTGTTNAFEVYDISNPAAPMLVSRKNLTVGGANAMYIQGRYAYIAQGGTTNAFEVFDLGGAYIQQLETGGIETTSLAVRGNLYAMDGNFQGGLTVERSLAVTGASSFVAASSTHNTATGIFNVTTASSTSSIISALGNGRVGIGSTTPFAKLSISANFGETNTTLFAIGSSTSASATTTLFTVLSTGQVNIPTGSLGFPGLSFVGDTTTGIYRPTASALGVIAGGTESFRVTGVNAIIRNDGVYQFATGALTAGGADAGLSRFGAGVVALGNGTAANTSGTLLATMIGLGTTTPFGALQIGTTTGKNLVLSDTAAGTNLKHWLFSSHGGNLYIGTTTDLYATSTPAFTLLGGTGSNAGYFGLGTSSPFSKLSVSGASSLAKFKSTTNVANALSVENAAGSNVFQIDTLDTNGSLFTIATSTGTSYMEVTSAGNIGIGTSTPGAKFDIYNGALCVDDSTPTCQNAARTAGTIYAVATSITGIDIAESYPTKDGTLAAGQIVVFDPANPVFVKRAHTGAQAFLGVVSTAPGIVLGGYNDDLYAAEHKVPIALAGRVPVTVNMEGGSIAVGDLITLSSVDGVGKKATESGQTIGIALESATGAGTIQVFIKPEYSFIPTQFALNPTTGNVGIGVATPSQKLEVAGNGLFNGSVTASHFNALGAGTSTLSRLAVSNAFTLGSQYLTSFTGTGLALDGGILSIASSTFANLHTQGGNSFGTTSVIGTRDTNDITFITASTTRLTITADGKVGIGTTTPNHALQVVGDIGAIGFVNTSTRTAKTDITYLTASTTENILERIQAVRVARYHYKIEDDNEPLRLGLIAEEAPYEVLSADGKGVDVYKLASFTLAGVQALAHKVDTIEEKVASIDERLTQLQNVSLHQATTTDTNTDVIATTTGALQQLFRGVGALIQNGVAQFNTLVARQFVASKDADGTSSAGAGTILTGNTSVEVTNKIARASSKIFVTFTSPVDGGWYLSEKKDGSFRVVLKTAATEDVTFDYFIVQTEGQLASPESLAGGPAPEHGPTITLNGASPYYVAVGESYAEPGANAFDGSGATIEYNVAVDGQTTNLHPQLDTSAPRTFTITYTAFDSHGSFSTKTRTVIVAAPGETTPPAQTPDGGSTEPPVPPEVPSGELTSEPETPPAPTDTGTTTPDA
jgi:hypothetical protein